MQEQHPVPQQISSYQFRLVGDMTLKQFFELAGGVLVGLLIYSTSIPALFKWPLIIISVLFGAALAFLPLEDRPLEMWVMAFFRSIYSPTIYYWARTRKEQTFQEEGATTPPLGVIAPRGEAELNKYLAAKPESRIPFLAKLEDTEKGFLSKITTMFGLIPSQSTKPVPIPTAQIPLSTPGIAAPLPIATQHQTTTPPVSKVVIPKTQFIRTVEPNPKASGEESPKIFEENSPIETTGVAPTLASEKLTQAVQQAQYSLSAAPPMPPSQPNTLTGQVMDGSGRIIEGAILEMKDAAGRPVRAVKTNKLGHFYIVTPLSDGIYEIVTEKESYVFDTVKFTAEGKIIPPIAIRAKKAISSAPNAYATNTPFVTNTS